MTSREMIFYFFGGTAAIVFFISISYWSVNFFIKQCSERMYEQFRDQLARESEKAVKAFREGLCEQIVQQENKSDSLAKLYATLIDLLRVGKEFSSSLGKGDLQQAEKMFRGIRNNSESFSEMYQKQRLHFSEEFCLLLDGFITDQKGVIEKIEGNWHPLRKESQEAATQESAVKQSWLHFEDRITHMMDTMRSEFRQRHSATSNLMMKWLSEPPPS